MLTIPKTGDGNSTGDPSARLRDVAYTLRDSPLGLKYVVFNNVMGLADGSFASVTRPGTGLCETCHTRTRFYRNNGTGEPHFPYTCITCHPHADGFAPD